MRRDIAVAGALAVLVGGCSGSSAGPASSTAQTTSPPPVSTEVATTTSTLEDDPEALLVSWIAALNDGDVDGALGLVASDAVWASPFFELRLDRPVPDDLSWLLEAFELGSDATGFDILHRFMDLETDLRAVRAVDDCRLDGIELRCHYTAVDAMTPLLGVAEGGEIGVVVERDLITRLELVTEEVASQDRLADADAFLRWALVKDPYLSLDQPSAEGVDVVALLDDWEAAGRPDIPTPADAGPDAVGVIAAWLEARELGDWERHVALMGGQALTQEMGSRDDFEAAGLLARKIKLGECAVTLESERVGVIIGCVVTVEDIITAVVGSEPSNPNVSTFQVRGGRITALPEFIPSLFLAEEALEIWGAAAYPDEYAAACPAGITNPLGVEDRSCAQFLVNHEGEWAAAALEPYG